MRLTILALGLLCISGPAFAETPSPELLSPATAAPDPSQPVPLALDELGDVSAGAGTITNVVSSQDLTATNSGNTITAGTVQNGDINFSGDALTGFSGVGNFVSNTGNNNNLQGSISINIIGAPISQ
jgi:hypothetical protein